MMAEVMRDPAHVVLDVPSVIGEIRVPPTGSGREQDIDAALARNAPHPRVDGTIADASNQKRPLEIIQKRAPKGQHLPFECLAFHHDLLDALPSANHCRA